MRLNAVTVGPGWVGILKRCQIARKEEREKEDEAGKELVAAMKAKQTVDPAQCDALEHAVEDFSKMYLPAEAE